jgi:hypothetical protein
MTQRGLALTVLLVVIGASPSAQERPDVAAQKEAMRKLAFLVGQWSGEGTHRMGPGAPRTLKQTEDVRYKLDGLVLLVEGTGRHPQTGAVEFNALATIAYDDRTKTYRFRAHNNGHYLDTELIVRDRGVEWGHAAGQARVRNVMTLDAEGRWTEFTEVTIGDGPPRRTVELIVTK